MDLEKLSNEELEKIYVKIQKEIEKRKDQRKKELWGNVVSAIKKYHNEIGDIEIHNNYNCDAILDCDKLKASGFLFGS